MAHEVTAESLLDTLPGAEWEYGEMEDHSKRWYAVLRWDDYEHRLHQSIRSIGHATLDEARESVLDEYRHGLERPDLHWPYDRLRPATTEA